MKDGLLWDSLGSLVSRCFCVDVCQRVAVCQGALEPARCSYLCAWRCNADIEFCEAVSFSVPGCGVGPKKRCHGQPLCSSFPKGWGRGYFLRSTPSKAFPSLWVGRSFELVFGGDLLRWEMTLGVTNGSEQRCSFLLLKLRFSHRRASSLQPSPARIGRRASSNVASVHTSDPMFQRRDHVRVINTADQA